MLVFSPISRPDSDAAVVDDLPADLEQRKRSVKVEVAVIGGLRRRNLFKRVQPVVVVVAFLTVLPTAAEAISLFFLF